MLKWLQQASHQLHPSGRELKDTEKGKLEIKAKDGDRSRTGKQEECPRAAKHRCVATKLCEGEKQWQFTKHSFSKKHRCRKVMLHHQLHPAQLQAAQDNQDTSL